MFATVSFGPEFGGLGNVGMSEPGTLRETGNLGCTTNSGLLNGVALAVGCTKGVADSNGIRSQPSSMLVWGLIVCH